MNGVGYGRVIGRIALFISLWAVGCAPAPPSSGRPDGGGGGGGGGRPPTLELLAGQLGGAGNADGVGTEARFDGINAMVSDGVGHLYVTEDGDGAVRVVALADGATTTLAHVSSLYGLFPTGVAAVGAGDVYVADWGNNVIRHVDVASRQVTTSAGDRLPGSGDGAGAAARFYDLKAIASDRAGHVFVSDGDTVRELALASGQVTTLAGAAGQSGDVDGPGGAARFSGPSQLAVDPAGNVFVVDVGNFKLRKLVPATGEVSTLRDPSGAPITAAFVSALAADGAGRLYLATDAGLEQLDLASGARATLVARNDPFSPGIGAVVLDGAGHLYYALSDATVHRVDLTGVTDTIVAGVPGVARVTLGPLPGGLSAPSGLALLPSGDLVIADRHESAILLAHLGLAR